MENILLFDLDDRPFETETIDRIFRSEPGFRNVRFDEPGGAVIEAEYVEPDDWTFVRLDGDRDTISLTGTSDAALRAALILQRNLPMPLRMVDTSYSFDVILRDFQTFEELRAAIVNAQPD
jgi:hypothetical protein